MGHKLRLTVDRQEKNLMVAKPAGKAKVAEADAA